MSSWAAVSDVQARLTYETIGASANPTTTQVQAWLDEAEGLIRIELRASGLPTTYSDTDTVNVLTSWATDYAHALTLMSWASHGGPEVLEQGQMMMERFEANMERIRKNSIKVGEALSPTGTVTDSVQFARSHVTEDSTWDGSAVITIDENF